MKSGEGMVKMKSENKIVSQYTNNGYSNDEDVNKFLENGWIVKSSNLVVKDGDTYRIVYVLEREIEDSE